MKFPFFWSEKNNRTFFSVGLPIELQENTSVPGLREKISSEEIINSFSPQNLTTIRLFQTEKDALEYSRFLQKSNNLSATKPALFKVHYVTNKACNWVTETLVINENSGYQEGIWPKAAPKDDVWYDKRKRNVAVQFFEVERQDVEPISGQMKVHLGKKGQFKTYPSCEYKIAKTTSTSLSA